MFPGLEPGDSWCARRWAQARDAGFAPEVYLRATATKDADASRSTQLKTYALDLAEVEADLARVDGMREAMMRAGLAADGWRARGGKAGSGLASSSDAFAWDRRQACSRGAAPQCVLVESLHLGATSGSVNDFNGVLNDLRRAFPPGSYALTSRNCNHFSDAFVRALGLGGIPAVNRRGALRPLARPRRQGPQVGGDAPAPAPAPAPRDPAREQKKELTAEQRAILAAAAPDGRARVTDERERGGMPEVLAVARRGFFLRFFWRRFARSSSR
ncbi:Lys63-specific deubiquitinase [Aureococcus anophagefferens]|nr:Lys63-specific deubiquitinase [Aureococcus anophagefferens]